MTERERLKKLLAQSPAHFCDGCKEVPEERTESIEMLADYLIASDVVEVRHGYWYIPEYEFLGCSECGEWYFTGADSTAEAKERLSNGECYPFCPHCGAKMDGERREG